MPTGTNVPYSQDWGSVNVGRGGARTSKPKTARGISKRLERSSKPFDPDFNVDAGTWLLARLLVKAEGDETHALIAYNRGWGYVKKYIESGDPLPERPLAYVEKVQRARRAFARSQFAAPEPVSAGEDAVEDPAPDTAESDAAAESNG